MRIRLNSHIITTGLAMKKIKEKRVNIQGKLLKRKSMIR